MFSKGVASRPNRTKMGQPLVSACGRAASGPCSFSDGNTRHQVKTPSEAQHCRNGPQGENMALRGPPQSVSPCGLAGPPLAGQEHDHSVGNKRTDDFCGDGYTIQCLDLSVWQSAQ
jgi:hypothetical protein